MLKWSWEYILWFQLTIGIHAIDWLQFICVQLTACFNISHSLWGCDCELVVNVCKTKTGRPLREGIIRHIRQPLPSLCAVSDLCHVHVLEVSTSDIWLGSINIWFDIHMICLKLFSEGATNLYLLQVKLNIVHRNTAVFEYKTKYCILCSLLCNSEISSGSIVFVGISLPSNHWKRWQWRKVL